jgi:hypothetical protein
VRTWARKTKNYISLFLSTEPSTTRKSYATLRGIIPCVSGKSVGRESTINEKKQGKPVNMSGSVECGKKERQAGDRQEKNFEVARKVPSSLLM